MANFEGTIPEFIKFIGGYSRNKVQYITRKHKLKIKKCEECNSRTKKLDAAHIKENGRKKIISDILKNFYVNENVYIDLQEFENLFVEAHEPIENTIKILCKDCHLKYDNIKEFIENAELEIKTQLSEAEIIETLVLNGEMNKNNAIESINRKGLLLDYKNTIFSNPNSKINVWWLEPHNDKFKNDINIVLNYPKTKTLYHFLIKSNEIINPEILFEQRNDRQASKLLIKISESEFKDKKGFDFKKYLTNEIKY